MQIFGSTSGATQMMLRGYSANGGELRGAGATVASGVYGVERRVNVIHLQEDSGNRIQIYINGSKKADIADNESVTNYHKYGCYGTLTTGSVTVRWRQARSYRDGSPPSGATPTPQPTATPAPSAGPSPSPTPTSGGGGGTWAPNTSYSVGATVTYGGASYRCLQAHTSLVGWEPPNAPSLWQRL
jgi:hypothetical protein